MTPEVSARLDPRLARTLPDLPTRTLHVVDLAGLVVPSSRFRVGSSQRRASRAYPAVVRAYVRAAELGREDAALVLDVDSVLDRGIPTVLVPWDFSENQEPLRLTADYCVDRFDRVVVASRDDRLATWVEAIAAVGLPVTLVYRAGLVAPALAALANTRVCLPMIGSGGRSRPGVGPRR